MESAVEGLGGKKKVKVKPGSFQGLGLNQSTFKAIMKMGYKMPTPIQRKTIPVILDGQDVVAMARTGSGKTAAFLIPIIERLGSHSVSVGFRAVALSPTRELAMQTAKFFRQLSRFTDLRCCLLVGGQAMEAQFEHLANNPDVIIATPGRLAHHVVEAELSLSRVEILVIDEADRLFELGFAEQLQKILEATPLSRQCLLFSATLPSQLVAFSRAGVKDPVFIRLDVETTLSDSLDLWFLYVRKDEKIAAAVSVLRRLDQGGKSTIMFVATRHHVEFFGELLKRLGFLVAIVYGSMDQDARTEQIARFRSKKAGILVTTDVAARGIDVPLLDHVLNYDFPPSGKLFVHRAGRTARAGRSGLAVSLVALDDLPYTVELMLFLGRKLTVADNDAAAVGAGPGGAPLLGSLPSLEHEVETLTALLQDEGSDLQSFHKSMMASYHLYNKTRPAASKQSVGRAKQLLEDCGGPARMQGLIHPAFRETPSAASSALGKVGGHSTVAGTTDFAFIQELRGFRPKAEKVGNVLSTSATRVMEAAKLDASAAAAAASAASRAAGGRTSEAGLLLHPLGGKLNREVAGGAQAKDRNRGQRRSLKRNRESSMAQVVVDKPRHSKRARLKLGKVPSTGVASSTAGVNAEDFAEFDVKVDGVSLPSASAQTPSSGSMAGVRKASKRQSQEPQFFLSTERDALSEAKERGLDMEQYQMDLMPDDSSDIKKAKSVIRWDAKKKKYLPVMVSVDGRVVKKGQHRNESGAIVKGEGEKTNIYKKWAKATKKRIQKVGEMEQAYSHPLSRNARLAAASANRTVEFDDAGTSHVAGAGDGEGESQRKRKPIVPFHGEIEAKYLTNKQKRMLKRRERNDRVVSGPAKKELKSVDQIKLDKKARDRNKLKQTPHLRKEKARQAKQSRIQKLQERQMAGARTKSKMLIFEGPKKSRGNKGRGARRGMPTI